MATYSTSPTLQAQDTSVSGISERTITGSGSPQAQVSGVSGVAERKITQNVNTYYRPLDDSIDIYYDDLDIVIIDDPASFLIGTYAITSAAFTTNGFTLSANSSYRTWEIDNGNGTYDVFIYNTSLSEWDVYPDQTASITTKSAGDTLSPALGYDVANINNNQLYTEISPAFVRGVISVSGSAKRETTTSGSLSAQQSSISALAEREVPAPTGALGTSLSSTSGTSERVVTGSGSLQAQVSDISGVAERNITGSGVLQSQDVSVSGVSENLITGSGTLQSQSSTVSGVSENLIIGSGTLQSQDVSVSGTTKKTITGSGDLNDNDVSVIGGSGERVVPMIPEEGNGDFRPTEYHLVTGEAERIIVLQSSVEVKAQESVVDGLSEHSITGSGTLNTITDSIVAGVAEKKVTASGALTTGDSTLSGVAERVIVEVEADLTADEVGVVAITGESERIIVGSGTLSVGISSVSGATVITSNGTGALQSQSSSVTSTASGGANGQGALVSQDSTVLGVSENVIVGDGPVASGSSSVSGVVERQIDGTGSGNSQSGPSDVIGVAERTVVGSGVIVVEATLFPATGFSERTITGSGAPQSQSSRTSGYAERSVENNNIVLQSLSGPSSVSGTAVRHSNGAGVLFSQVSVVSGASEREITGSGSIETVTDSIVTGIAENVISGTGTLVTSSSSLSGVSERVITGSGTLDTITDSTVVGVAENQIDLISGIEQVDVSTVSGVSERTVNAVGELNTVSDSIVSGVSERANLASGALTTNASVVVGTTSRTINRLPDINGYPNDAGDTAFGPDSTDSKVDYVSRPGSYAPRYLELNGTSNVNRDGVYDVLISGFTVAESALSYVPTATTTSNVYYKERGGNYDVVVYNTTRSAWYLTTISDIDQFFTGGIPNATVAQESLVSTNSSVPYGIEFDPLDAQVSRVVGLAERIIVDVFTDLQGPEHNIITGISEREAVAGTGFLQDGFSRVTAVANIGRITSPELVTDSSVVDGVAERIVTVDAGIEQTDASVVAGVSERIITGEGTLVQSTDSVVAGVAERIITVDAGIDMPDDASEVVGLSERKVVLVSGIEQVDVSTVAGVSERIITASGELVTSSSIVTGVAEREITGSGTLDTITDFLVNGVAERVITVDAGIDMPDDVSRVTGIAERFIGKFFGTDPKAPDNIVNGVAERTVENNNITLQVIAQESTIVGLGERTINLLDGIFSADSASEESTIVGISERTINGQGELDTVSDSLVVGVAERQIDAEGDLNTITDSLVSGVAERIVTVDAGIDMPDDDSKVVGVAERTIENNLINQALVASESEVVGVAEREITGSGTLDTITDSLVTGVAEREIETNEIRQDLKPTENNLVTGVAERTVVIVSSAGLKAQDASVETNDGLPITIDRHPIGGPIYPEYRSDLYAGDAQPVLDADRVITQRPDGLSDIYRFAPNVADPNVTYVGPNDELLKLSGLDPNYDNIYKILPEGYTVATSGGTDYQLTRDDDHYVYYWRNRSAGYNEYRVCAYRTTNGSWTVFETTLNPELFFEDGLVIPNSIATSITVANTRKSKRGPYKEMRPTEYNLVVGDGDKVHENYETPSDLVTDDCLVTAVVERTINDIDPSIQPNPSIVTGVAERTSEDNGLTHALRASPSTVVSVAERALTGTGTLIAATSGASGTTERKIVRVVDGRGPLAYSPREEDANVVYHTGPNITIKGLTASDSQYNGGYNLLGVLTPTLCGFRVVESGNDYTLVHDASYNVYYTIVQPDYAYSAPHWHIVIFNTTRNAWYAAETAIDPRAFDDGLTISEAVIDHAHIDDFSELRPGPYGTQQGDDSEVTSVVERTSNSIDGTIASGPSTVNAVTEITSNLLESNVKADGSEVDATVIRKIVSIDASLQSGVSEVFATDDRTIVSVPGKSKLKATDSTTTSVTKISRFASGDVSSDSSIVSGVAERSSNGTGELHTDDHVVNGVAERKITAVGTLVATAAVTETVVGVAERTVVNIAPTNVQASNSVTDGFAYRIITSFEADLECDNSVVEGIVYNNVPAQDAMHTQRVFRIRKEPIRTIIVRQTPTRNAR